MDAGAVVPKKSEPKLTPRQMIEKCRQKFEEDRQKRLRDPVQRQAMQRSEVMVLQAMNAGAQERLNLSDQAFSRLLELQAEQVITESGASIGNPNLPSSPSVNPQIAEEFGDDIATKWASYQREYRARAATHAVANLLADANMSLTEEQKRKLTQVYADEYEMEDSEMRSGDPADVDSEGGNLDMRKRFEMQLSRLQSFAQRTQAEAGSFLTLAQLELLRKKSDRDVEQLRSMTLSMPKHVPAPTFQETDVEC
jgi:hypothetical protein